MLLAEQNNRWACHLLKEEEGWVWRERDFWHHRGLLRDLGQTDSQKPALANLVLNPDTKHRMASPGTSREPRSLRQAAGLTNSPPPHPQKVLTPILQPTSGYFREAVTATMGAALSLRRQKAQISTINSQTFWVNSLPVYISTLCLHCSYWREKSTHTANLPSQNWSGVNESISNLYCKWGWYISVTFQTITHSQH